MPAFAARFTGTPFGSRRLPLLAGVTLAAGAVTQMSGCSSGEESEEGQNVTIVNSSTVPIYAAVTPPEQRPRGLDGLPSKSIRPNGNLTLSVDEASWIVLGQTTSASEGSSWLRRVPAGLSEVHADLDRRSGMIAARLVME